MPGCVSSLTVVLLSALIMGVAQADNAAWAQVRQPSKGPSEVIGFYTAGCLSGGAALPISGPGYQVMRIDRNRYYGHPRLINFIKHLGASAQQQGAKLLIGDLSQPRGGPMNYGHNSHQVGLDADIWLQHLDNQQRLTPKKVLTMPMRSVVDKKRGRLIAERWSPIYTTLLRETAQHPDVERVFVNPVIKQALCRDPINHAWLNKIRPWWGHDAHFHVRLACPPDSPQCRAQDAPPRGSGCDKYLDQWVLDQISPPKKRKRSSRSKPRSLPSACQTVLRPF